jgi:hypothetical protein
MGNSTHTLNQTEFNRFGLITIILLLIGCLGGIAVGLGAVSNTLALIAIVIPTMITLSFLLAVAPMKWIINAGAVAAFIDIAFILYYSIM